MSLPAIQRISIHKGDITTQECDAIVKAANETLQTGSGVNGAIHRAAGPDLPKACEELGGCGVGEAKITPGFQLKSKYIIHTVGPVWKGGRFREAELLQCCYVACMEFTISHQIRTIAFPSISTGAYGFPITQACPIALNTMYRILEELPDVREVRFICFSEEDYQMYQRTFDSVKRLRSSD